MKKYSACAWLGSALLLLSSVPATAQTPATQRSPCRYDVPAIEQPIPKLRQQAQAGDHTATCLIALKYLIGSGVERDTDKAVHWLQQGAKKRRSKHPSVGASMYYLAQMILRAEGGLQRDTAKALTLLREAVQRNHLQAHVYLGLLLTGGEDITANPEEAISLYRRAAALNYAPAMFYLGNAYEQGTGLLADPEQASYWYQKSAEGGLAEGQYNIAVRLLNGHGVAVDVAQATSWLQQATEQGLEEARALLVTLRSTQNTAGQVAEHRAAATISESDLGNSEQSRTATPTQPTSPPAVTSDRRQPSARPRRGVRSIAPPTQKSLQQQQYESLQQATQLLREDAPGHRQGDDAAAFEILLQLANQGHPIAQFQVGTLYQLGRGTAADPSNAGLWYQRAARQGLPQAQHRLALLYAAGVGHPQNLLEAYIWLSLAVAQSNNDGWRQQRDAILGQLSTAGREQAQLEAQRRWNKIHGNARSKQPAPATPTR